MLPCGGQFVVLVYTAGWEPQVIDLDSARTLLIMWWRLEVQLCVDALV